MSRRSLGVLVGGLAAVALVAVAVLNTHSSRSELFFAPAMPSLAEYTAYPTQPGAGVFEYSVMAPTTGGQTYTYNTMAAPAASSYQYDTTQPASDYTYTAMPSSDGLTFYNAQETSPQMTVINGYATEGNNMEQWNTIPVGTLHPLDTAGDWESGAFNSINPDGTARASAPLTLSGERADGTVKSEDARASRGMGLVPSQLKGARLTELLQLPARSERAIWNTPSSKVEKLSPHDQQVWAKHVMAQHALHKVWATKSQDVRKLPAAEQRVWAEHVVAEAKKHAEEEKGNAKWASKVQRLLRQQHAIRHAVAGSRAAHAAHKLHRAKFDTFGMPELSGKFSGLAADGMRSPETLAGITKSLAEHRPCGPACQQRAIQSATAELPIH